MAVLRGWLLFSLQPWLFPKMNLSPCLRGFWQEGISGRNTNLVLETQMQLTVRVPQRKQLASRVALVALALRKIETVKTQHGHSRRYGITLKAVRPVQGNISFLALVIFPPTQESLANYKGLNKKMGWWSTSSPNFAMTL